MWYTNPGGDKIGYRPQDNAEDYVAALGEKDMREDDIEAAFQGGPLCSAEFDGSIDRIS